MNNDFLGNGFSLLECQKRKPNLVEITINKTIVYRKNIDTSVDTYFILFDCNFYKFYIHFFKNNE